MGVFGCRWNYCITSLHCMSLHITAHHITSPQIRLSHSKKTTHAFDETGHTIATPSCVMCMSYMVQRRRVLSAEVNSAASYAMPCHAMSTLAQTNKKSEAGEWKSGIQNRSTKANPKRLNADPKPLQAIQKPAENGGINNAQTPVMNTSLFATAPQAQVKATIKKVKKVCNNIG